MNLQWTPLNIILQDVTIATKPASLLCGTNITIVQHKHHYCTAQTSLLYSTNITIVQHKHHYCKAQTHGNIRTERQASDIFSSIRRTGIPCDSRQLYESNWTLHSSITCIYKKKKWNKNWWVTHHLDQSTRAIPRGGYRARFFPSSFFISSNIQSWQKKILLS